jgi:hypothetical protein
LLAGYRGQHGGLPAKHGTDRAQKKRHPFWDAAFAIEGGGELNERHFHCVRAFFALGDFELHFVVFTNLVNEVRYVNEDILAGAVYFDEAEAFGFVEEFYGSCLHNAREKMGL